MPHSNALIDDRTDAQATHGIGEVEYGIPAGIDQLVNAVPVGLYPDTTPRVSVLFDSLQAAIIAGDVIPNPPRILFIGVDRREVLSVFGNISFPFLQFYEIRSDGGDTFCTLASR